MKLWTADWPAPPGIRACVSTRHGGVSQGAKKGLNLASHVGDRPENVRDNREQLRRSLKGLDGIQWLSQVHGTDVHVLQHQAEAGAPRADALYTRSIGVACAVLTADCLPVCFCSADGREIAVAHAGWRGLAAGILENTLRVFRADEAEIHAWLGPAIGPCHFEVGDEVRAAFLHEASEDVAEQISDAFVPGVARGKWMADLYQLARIRLQRAGLASISGGGRCTYCEDEDFYSHRRDPESGRFATLIYRLR